MEKVSSFLREFYLSLLILPQIYNKRGIQHSFFSSIIYYSLFSKGKKKPKIKTIRKKNPRQNFSESKIHFSFFLTRKTKLRWPDPDIGT